MKNQLFDIPTNTWHRADQGEDLKRALVPYEAQDWYEALEPLKEVAKTGNILAIFKYPNTLSNLCDSDSAEHFWRIVIEAGHGDARNNLSNLLRNRGELEQARAMHFGAAEAGSADAMENLALLEPQGSVETELWFLRVAQAGSAEICGNLALHYFKSGKT